MILSISAIFIPFHLNTELSQGRIVHQLQIHLTNDLPAATKHISHVTVHFEQARETLKHPQGEGVLYTATWRIHDKNGQSGTFRIYNSFSL
jgi:hypothetical protein